MLNFIMKLVIDKEVVCWSKLDDETLLMNLDTGYCYTLDEMGGKIWEMLLENRLPEEIVLGIMTEYAVERPVIENDLKALLDHLQLEGLIIIE